MGSAHQGGNTNKAFLKETEYLYTKVKTSLFCKTLQPRPTRLPREANRKMALYSILRRASSPALHLALRSAATPRSFHSAISAAITVGKRDFSQELNPASFLKILRSYSTAPARSSADASLVRVLESEIKCAEEDDQNGVSS